MLSVLDLRGVPAAQAIHLPRPDLGAEGPVEDVRAILADVRSRGDAAVRELTRRFDGVDLGELRVPAAEIEAALDRVPPRLREALVEARDSIEAFHRHRAPLPERYERGGITVDHLELAVERAGVYAPGGRAKYPSSVLMTAVPARVAGVSSVVCCVPPGPDGSLPDEILAAAALAGVDEVYRVGGAQAIGAMAYGTESIPKVDVIVGPGSKWVSIAQREVRGVVGVPAAFAGPSEVVVIADGSVPAEWAAIDVVVQAEHGPDGLAWLVTWSEDAAREIAAEIERVVGASPRRDETLSTLHAGGHVVLVDGPEQAMRVSNEIAPEHLELLVADPDHLVRLVRNAGAVFVGPLAPASVGDYIAGPSHVLPTFGTARFASVLGVEDFVRRVHAIRVDRRGAQRVARHVAAIADAEGLPAHAESVRLRLGEATWSSP
ncbi:MAG TPA: histidinol dehydrogenase [Acidimicrobiales bacterium]|nr:histidinol dehydrogenase [Acidimicrobiales bacterium]